MKKIIPLIICFLLAGCGLFRPHRINIEQGNIIMPANVSKLHVGMNQTQVKNIMGNPVLIQPFTADRIEYVYTMQRGYDPMQETRVTCIFNHRGKLTNIIF